MLKPILEIKDGCPTVPSGSRLKRMRIRRMMTRKQLARESGFTAHYIKVLELEIQKLPRKHLSLFASILDCESDDFLKMAKR